MNGNQAKALYARSPMRPPYPAQPVQNDYQGTTVKMGPIRRTIARWLLGVNSAPSYEPTIKAVNTLDSQPNLNFKIYDAIGGKIVEFNRYDRQRDEHIHQIYIIGKDEDFGEKIAKIAMLETLR